MARGGARPGAGRPKTAVAKKETVKKAPPKSTVEIPPDISKAASKAALTPLEYMLTVMNSEDADDGRRDRMAVAAAPFVHKRAEESGKKSQRADAAQAAGAGRLSSPPPPPRLVTSK